MTDDYPSVDRFLTVGDVRNLLTGQVIEVYLCHRNWLDTMDEGYKPTANRAVYTHIGGFTGTFKYLDCPDLDPQHCEWDVEFQEGCFCPMTNEGRLRCECMPHQSFSQEQKERVWEDTTRVGWRGPCAFSQDVTRDVIRQYCIESKDTYGDPPSYLWTGGGKQHSQSRSCS
jgi:hypothetical protein